jgi:hypothetical protein
MQACAAQTITALQNVNTVTAEAQLDTLAVEKLGFDYASA